MKRYQKLRSANDSGKNTAARIPNINPTPTLNTKKRIFLYHRLFFFFLVSICSIYRSPFPYFVFMITLFIHHEVFLNKSQFPIKIKKTGVKTCFLYHLYNCFRDKQSWRCFLDHYQNRASNDSGNNTA